jgi:hypothetical protein
MYVKISQDNVIETFPFDVKNLKNDHPNTSFPRDVSDEDFLSQFGVYKVTIENQPQIDQSTQKVTQNAMPTLVDSAWVLGWTIVNKTESEIAEYQEMASVEARRLRNMYLSRTDWIVTYHTEKGTPIPQEWLDYRQALRDVTLQEGFPFDVAWPTIPE